MQTSRFQLGLLATLAVGLGFALASSQAIGYPAGVAVSMGSNPVFSFGGSLEPGHEVTVATAPSDSDVILTDVSLGLTSNSYSCRGSFSVQIEDDSGSVLGDFALSRGQLTQNVPTTLVSNMNSGIRIAAGRTVLLKTQAHEDPCGSDWWTIRYTLSGYYAQP